MVLRGERCVLRRWRAKDIGSLVQHANNINVSRYLRERFPYPYTRKDARAFLAGATGAGVDDTKLAIDVDGEAVGGIGVIVGTDIERFSAEVGYWLGEPFWGRGIATEALNLFSVDVFERLNLLRRGDRSRRRDSGAAAGPRAPTAGKAGSRARADRRTARVRRADDRASRARPERVADDRKARLADRQGLADKRARWVRAAVPRHDRRPMAAR
jgi:hypothetical protein